VPNGIDRHGKSGLVSVTFMLRSRSNSHLRSNVLRWLSSGLAAILLLASVPCSYAGQPKPKKLDGRHQIDQLEEAWRTAVLASDANSMSNLLADDYMAILANGTLQTKDQALAAMRSGRIHVNAFAFSDQKVRFYGKTAVVTSLAHVEGVNPEVELNGEFRYTRVYAKNSQGEWKIVSFEASRISLRDHHR